MATIITKNSQTASAVPSAASLQVGELAVNTADGKLYTEHTGGVVKEIIPSTVVDGGITTAKIADNAITTAKIADGAVTTNKLSNSGVTAGTYGSASVVPVVTVDAKGRLTTVSTASIAASAPTTAQVLSATAGATAGAVGTYAWLSVYTPSGVGADSTRAGSAFDGYAGVVNDGNNPNTAYLGWGGGSRSGTWRAMGQTVTGGFNENATLFLRIS